MEAAVGSLSSCFRAFYHIKSVLSNNAADAKRLLELCVPLEPYIRHVPPGSQEVVAGLHSLLEEVAQVCMKYVQSDQRAWLGTNLLQAGLEAFAALTDVDIERDSTTFDELRRQVQEYYIILGAVAAEDMRQRLIQVQDDLTTGRQQSHVQMINIPPQQVTIDHSRILGEGGFSIVRLGKYRGMDVAVKKIMVGNANSRRQVENEIYLLHLLQHPNILSIYGFTQKPDSISIIMELAELGSLKQFLRRSPALLPSPAQRWRYLQEMIMAVVFLHSCGVVHRDIKADNFVVFGNHRIKLCDFGLARQQYQGTTLVGSQFYIAPEVLQGKGARFASDVYAFALCVAFVCDPFLPLESYGDRKVEYVQRALQTFASFCEELLPVLVLAIDDEAEKRPSSENVQDVLIRAHFPVLSDVGVSDDDDDNSFSSAAPIPSTTFPAQSVPNKGVDGSIEQVNDNRDGAFSPQQTERNAGVAYVAADSLTTTLRAALPRAQHKVGDYCAALADKGVYNIRLLMMTEYRTQDFLMSAGIVLLHAKSISKLLNDNAALEALSLPPTADFSSSLEQLLLSLELHDAQALATEMEETVGITEAAELLSDDVWNEALRCASKLHSHPHHAAILQQEIDAHKTNEAPARVGSDEVVQEEAADRSEEDNEREEDETLGTGGDGGGGDGDGDGDGDNGCNDGGEAVEKYSNPNQFGPLNGSKPILIVRNFDGKRLYCQPTSNSPEFTAKILQHFGLNDNMDNHRHCSKYCRLRVVGSRRSSDLMDGLRRTVDEYLTSGCDISVDIMGRLGSCRGNCKTRFRPIDWSFDQLEILERLGSSGQVFKAKHKTVGPDDLQLVVKIVHCFGDEDRSRVLAMYDRIISSLASNEGDTNIKATVCGYLSAFSMPAGPLPSHDVAVVMCKYQTTLADLISSQTQDFFKPRLICELALAVLQALQFLHALNIVHRDVKPSNIFCDKVCTDESMYFFLLGDLECSKELDQATKVFGHGTGSFSYLAPEVYTEHVSSPKSDLWNVGVLLHQLICPDHYHKPKPMHTLIQRSDFQSIIKRDLREHMLSPLVLRMLTAAPVQRINVADAITELQRICEANKVQLGGLCTCTLPVPRSLMYRDE